MGEEKKNEMSNKNMTTTAKPPLPRKAHLLISIASFVNDLFRRRDGTVNRRLVTFLDPTNPPTPTPTRGVSSTDIVLDSTSNLWARLYLPSPAPASHPLPVIVFFHGGGFAFLSPASRLYDEACRRFSRQLPAAVLSVNYRLSPEHRYPASYDDGVEVLHQLNSRNPKLQALLEASDLSKTFLAGDSAGANIAHHVARRWASTSTKPDGGGGGGAVNIIGVVAIQPFFGGEERLESETRLSRAPLVNVERTDWLWKAFLPEGETRDHEAANVVLGKGMEEIGRMEGFPKVMVVMGGFDPLQDWQRRYVEALRERGRKEVVVVEYPEAIHAFYLFNELPEAKMLVEEIKKFVEIELLNNDK